MPNTTIQLKKSSTPSAKPADLANGELAINFADGKLYYKNTTSSIVEITPTQSSDFGTVSANGTLLVADTTGDVLTINPGNNISIVGDAVNDRLVIGLKDNVSISGTLNLGGTFTHSSGDFFINNMSGAGGSSEGGEIKFANGTSATQLLSGPVSIDIYENRIRFFETNSPNRGAFINLAAAGASVGTDLLVSASATDSTARATASAAFDKANAANVLAFNALPNTSGVTFNGTLNISQNVSADKVISSNNGNGENFKVGDDAWLGDTNVADTVRLKGQFSPSNGYIMFGPNDGVALGRYGTNALTYGGNTVWHAGNDGLGSGLDADLLDGIHASIFANNATLIGANTAVGTGANAFASATIAGANSLFTATIAGANTAVGTGANAFASSTIAGANSAVGTGANAFSSATISGSNTFLISIIAGANTAVGTGANAFASSTIAGANSAVGTGANAFTSATIAGANTAVGTGANNFLLAVIAGANSAVGTGANNFMIVVQNGSNTAVGTGANAFASSTIAGANSAVGTGANAFTSATIAGANSAVGTAANSFASATIAGANGFFSATIAGANSAVGTGANSFASATIAGANTAVGTGANAFTSATVAGANTAVGTAANSFASATIAGANTAVGTAANSFASATIAGANTAVGTGANAFTSATIAGANTAVGTGANSFASATIAGANSAVGNGANNYSNATFVKLAAATQTISGNISITGSLFVSGNSYRVDANTLVVQDPLIYLAGNNYTSDVVDIGFIANYMNATGQNVHTGLYREHVDKEYYLFQGYDKEPENNHIGALSNNMTLAVLNAVVKTSNLILGGANAITTITGVGTAANSFTSATVAGANAFTSATIAGANSAVGTGANAFTSATVAGANSAVGVGANAFTSATIAGANSAVGTAANNFAIATFGAANTRPVGNTLSNIYTVRSTRRSLNFIPSTNITINVDDDSAGDRANVTIAATGGLTAFATKIANYTAVNGDRLLCNTTAGTFIITLPATPTSGATVLIYDTGNFTANPLTVARNSSTIEFIADDFSLDIGQTRNEFVYDGSTWHVYSSIGPRGLADTTTVASSIAYSIALG